MPGELVWLYWQVGKRLRQDIVGEERGGYGEQIVEEVARALSAEYGRGFGKRSLYRMMRFVDVFPDPEIVTALRSQLSWTHLREIIAFDDPLKRQFYAEMCRIERWSTRTLQEKIAGMLTDLPPRKPFEKGSSTPSSTRGSGSGLETARTAL